MENTSSKKNSIKVLEENELSSVSGGHPILLGALAIVGAYQTGKEIGRGIKKGYNWAQEKLS